MAEKKAAKKATKKAAPKKADPVKELMKAVEAAQKAGYTVHLNISRVNDEGVSEERHV